MTSLLELIAEITSIFEAFGIDWVLGGSLASTYYAEPRSTIDADVAIVAAPEQLDSLIEALGERYYLPSSAADTGGAEGGSFNVIDFDGGYKVDVFVLGSSLLDRNQIARRRRVALEGIPGSVWLTSPEDVVLRKLSWWRDAGGSERQWRDLVQVLRFNPDLDLDYLRDTATSLNQFDELGVALREARRFD